jgi:hypothetical protein
MSAGFLSPPAPRARTDRTCCSVYGSIPQSLSRAGIHAGPFVWARRQSIGRPMTTDRTNAGFGKSEARLARTVRVFQMKAYIATTDVFSPRWRANWAAGEPVRRQLARKTSKGSVEGRCGQRRQCSVDIAAPRIEPGLCAVPDWTTATISSTPSVWASLSGSCQV